MKTLKFSTMKYFWITLFFVIGLAILNFFFLSPAAFLGSLLALMLIAGLSFYASYQATLSASWGKNEAELKSIILGLQDALLVFDRNFKVLFMNPAAERLFSLKADDILGRELGPQDVGRPGFKLIVQILFPSLAPRFLSRSKPGEYPQIVDISFEDPPLELREVTSAVYGENNRINGFVKIVQDRTREATLLKSKNEFIAVASHQLRTPITEITWALEYLKKEDLSPESKKILVSMEAAAKVLGEIVEGLLNVAKIEEGRFGYNFKETDMVKLLEDFLSVALPQLGSLGIKLYFDKPAEELPHVWVDEDKIKMVMQNLLDNATKYNTKNGQIIVKIERFEGPFIVVSVRDTGIGIPPAEAEKIFGKFFRAENALRFETGGAGLGLYIVKNIVRGHGGKIWFESELNRGTVFSFTLPTDPVLVPQKEVPLE